MKATLQIPLIPEDTKRVVLDMPLNEAIELNKCLQDGSSSSPSIRYLLTKLEEVLKIAQKTLD
jgi:hypothetical protein